MKFNWSGKLGVCASESVVIVHDSPLGSEYQYRLVRDNTPAILKLTVKEVDEHNARVEQSQ